MEDRAFGLLRDEITNFLSESNNHTRMVVNYCNPAQNVAQEDPLSFRAKETTQEFLYR